MKVCRKCGQNLEDDQKFCQVCGEPASAGDNGAGQQVPPNNGAGQQVPPNNSYFNCPPPGYVPKSRLLAGILGILLGAYGVHNFYLGFTTKAVIQIVVTFVTCGIGMIWGFVEGVMILCRKINVDAYGVPLKQDC